MNRTRTIGTCLALLAVASGPVYGTTFTIPVTGSQVVSTPEESSRLLVHLGTIEVGEDVAIGAAALRLGVLGGPVPSRIFLDIEAISVPWSVGSGTWDIETHEGLSRRVTLRSGEGGLSLDLSHIIRAAQDGTDIYGLVITAPAGNADGVPPAIAEAIEDALSQAVVEVSYRGTPRNARARRNGA